MIRAGLLKLFQRDIIKSIQRMAAMDSKEQKSTGKKIEEETTKKQDIVDVAELEFKSPNLFTFFHVMTETEIESNIEDSIREREQAFDVKDGSQRFAPS